MTKDRTPAACGQSPSCGRGAARLRKLDAPRATKNPSRNLAVFRLARGRGAWLCGPQARKKSPRSIDEASQSRLRIVRHRLRGSDHLLHKFCAALIRGEVRGTMFGLTCFGLPVTAREQNAKAPALPSASRKHLKSAAFAIQGACGGKAGLAHLNRCLFKRGMLVRPPQRR